MSEARAPLSAEALADPQPNVPHEKVRAEMLGMRWSFCSRVR